MCVCVHACMRACVLACVFTCVRVCMPDSIMLLSRCWHRRVKHNVQIFNYVFLSFSAVCPVGRFGAACASKCQCPNQVSCNHITGCQYCDAGWTGNSCATSKDFGLKTICIR